MQKLMTWGENVETASISPPHKSNSVVTLGSCLKNPHLSIQ